MFDHLNVVATSVFVFFFGLVSVLGFLAARWKAADLDHIHEWGLGGRRFGRWITWFLLGGDLYTAYTVIAIPRSFALAPTASSAVPYTITYPFLYLIAARACGGPQSTATSPPISCLAGMAIGLELRLRRPAFWRRCLTLRSSLLASQAFWPSVLRPGIMVHAPITIAFFILALFTYKKGFARRR